MTSWVDAEDALRAWVVAATSLLDASVVFGEQNGTRPPTGPQIIITLGNVNSLGVDEYVQVEEDIGAHTVDFEARGVREVMVQFRAYSPDATGDSTARALLSQVQLRSSFDSIRQALNNAGLGLLELGEVQNLPRVVNAGWESQANLECRFCVVQTATETIPYIELVNGDGKVSSPGSNDLDVPFSAELA